MKIKIADLEPNPFRDFDCYPIDRERIEGLKDSVLGDDFWGGIPVRPHPTKKGKYQIGCGHHRLVSLQENNIEEIDISCCRDYSDLQMLRIMVNENAEYERRPKLVNSDIEQTKKYLDAELAKSNTMSDLDLKYFAGLKTENEFASLKARGVGRGTIQTYLGKTWAKKGWMVESALATLRAEKDGTLNRKALETIPTLDQANKFRTTARVYETPKPIQKKIAQAIVKEKTPTKLIPEVFAKFSPPIPNLKKKKHRKIKDIPNIIEYIFKCENDTDYLNHRIKALLPEIGEIVEKGRLLGRLAPGLKRLEETISLFSIEYERIQNGKKKETKKVASVQVLD